MSNSRASTRVPKYAFHMGSGQAVVRLGGIDIYLGKHGSEESRAEYDRLIGEWVLQGRQTPGRPGSETALKRREFEPRSYSIALRLLAVVPRDAAHRERLHDPMHGAGADLQFTSQGLSIPTTWSHDAAKGTNDPTKPFALACSAFGIGSFGFLLRHSCLPADPLACWRVRR